MEIDGSNILKVLIMNNLKEIIEQLRDYPIEVESIDLNDEENRETKGEKE